METGDCGEQDDDAAQHDDHADDAVDELDAVGAELRADLVDEPRQTPPPEEGSADDADESHHHVDRLVDGQSEGKLGIERHEEEDDEGIAERDKKGGHGVVRQRSLLLSWRAQLARGVRAVSIKTEAQQQEASHNLEVEAVGVVVHEVDHETHAQTGDAGIDHVAKGSPAAGHETIPPALVQRALYAQNAHRPHRRGGDDAYQQALEDDVEYIWYGIYVKRHKVLGGGCLNGVGLQRYNNFAIYDILCG